MSDCDCTGPAARTETGECRVLAEFRVIRALQVRRAEGDHPTPAEVDGMCISAGLEAPSDAHRRAREERERDADGQGMEWRLQRLGVPPRALLDLRRLQETEAIGSARKFLQAPGERCPFLALLGDVGLGKTVAAAWAFREVARKTSPDLPTGTSEPLVWVQGPVFTRVSAFSADDERALERYRAAKLLVIDELGDESTALGISTVRDLCMAREAAGRRTVITSNLNYGPFEARYGKALWDRLHARGVVTGLKGKSMRGGGR